MTRADRANWPATATAQRTSLLNSPGLTDTRPDVRRLASSKNVRRARPHSSAGCRAVRLGDKAGLGDRRLFRDRRFVDGQLCRVRPRRTERQAATDWWPRMRPDRRLRVGDTPSSRTCAAVTPSLAVADRRLAWRLGLTRCLRGRRGTCSCPNSTMSVSRDSTRSPAPGPPSNGQARSIGPNERCRYSRRICGSLTSTKPQDDSPSFDG